MTYIYLESMIDVQFELLTYYIVLEIIIRC